MSTDQLVERVPTKEFQEQKNNFKKKGSYSLNKHAGSGAMIACLLAAIFALNYLVMTTYGYYGIGDSLMSYLVGNNFNLEEMASEALFVVVTRFLLVFGFSWFPITAIIALIKR